MVACGKLSVGGPDLSVLTTRCCAHPLDLSHIKPRLLGHWGTTPGLNFIYVHLNGAIRQYDLNIIYLTGPGHGGPGLVANALEGTYSEVYPNIAQDAEGMQRLLKAVFVSGALPSHVSPDTPGSIDEGGELGYSLAHAFGAVFDNPDLIVACVVGDGEAETGPLATSWHSNKFLNPVCDGAVLPILHLNGYKIAGPTVLARIPHDELAALFYGYGYRALFVEGDDPDLMHQAMAGALDDALTDIRRIQASAREQGFSTRPRWPMIILRSPKGWTGPKTVDGQVTEGSFRSHQVPMGDMRHAGHVQILEQWLQSYRPQELFDASGRLLAAQIAELAPGGTRRMSAESARRTAARCCAICACRIFATMRWQSHSLDRCMPKPRACKGSSFAMWWIAIAAISAFSAPDETASNRWERCSKSLSAVPPLRFWPATTMSVPPGG